MVDEWPLTRLGDVADLLTGFPFRSAEYIEDQSGVAILGGDNIVQGALRWGSVRRWPMSKLEGHEAYLLEAGDVVLAMDRPWIEAGLKHARVTPADLPALLVQRTARLRGTCRLDRGFLFTVVASAEFTRYVNAVATGTAVPHISAGQIRDFRLALPPSPNSAPSPMSWGPLTTRST